MCDACLQISQTGKNLFFMFLLVGSELVTDSYTVDDCKQMAKCIVFLILMFWNLYCVRLLNFVLGFFFLNKISKKTNQKTLS